MEGAWQQSQEGAPTKEMTRQQTDCNSMFSTKLIKNCFIYSCAKHTSTFLTGVNQHNEPVHNMHKIGWVSCILPAKPGGLTQDQWVLQTVARVDRSSNIGKSALPNKVFTREQEPDNL